jgi:small nuclear ribonucleoprotein (snRNP)-like protein
MALRLGNIYPSPLKNKVKIPLIPDPKGMSPTFIPSGPGNPSPVSGVPTIPPIPGPTEVVGSVPFSGIPSPTEVSPSFIPRLPKTPPLVDPIENSKLVEPKVSPELVTKDTGLVRSSVDTLRSWLLGFPLPVYRKGFYPSSLSEVASVKPITVSLTKGEMDLGVMKRVSATKNAFLNQARSWVSIDDKIPIRRTGKAQRIHKRQIKRDYPDLEGKGRRALLRKDPYSFPDSPREMDEKEVTTVREMAADELYSTTIDWQLENPIPGKDFIKIQRIAVKLKSDLLTLNMTAISRGRVESVYIPLTLRDLKYLPDSSIPSLGILGRNLQKYHYAGSEDTLEFKIGWNSSLSYIDSRVPILEKAMKIASFSKAHQGTLPIVRFAIVGITSQGGPNLEVFNSNYTYIVTKADFEITQINHGYKMGDNIQINPHPTKIEQTVVLKRISETRPDGSELYYKS